MFTGLVAAIGRIGSPRSRGRGLTFAVEHTLPGLAVQEGESIAVDGCCLTAREPISGRFLADLSSETLERTGGRLRWRAGRMVHLERALTVGDRLGGHLVQGHADGLVRVLALRKEPGGFASLRVSLPAEAALLAVLKGSVALDGVSLTISRRGGNWFEVALVPSTLEATLLGRRRPGDRVIVEWDHLARVALGAVRGPVRL